MLFLIENVEKIDFVNFSNGLMSLLKGLLIIVVIFTAIKCLAKKDFNGLIILIVCGSIVLYLFYGNGSIYLIGEKVFNTSMKIFDGIVSEAKNTGTQL